MSNAIEYAEWRIKQKPDRDWVDNSNMLYEPDLAKFRIWVSNEDERIGISPIRWED